MGATQGTNLAEHVVVALLMNVSYFMTEYAIGSFFGAITALIVLGFFAGAKLGEINDIRGI